MKRPPLVTQFLSLVIALAAAGVSEAKSGIDPDLLAGLAARSVGPAGMSGRVAAIEVVPGTPDTVWVGAATGGVWRSRNAGLSFEPVFDREDVAAIGAIAVHPARPEVVWVGTGEANPRNSASVGNGVYKSIDGGRKWRHLGLDRSERVSRIRVHPADPLTAYVAALGPTWGEGDERGVFKTTDGGESWQRSLYVDVRTGAADLDMDPRNPDKLLAAMWDHRRWPWSFRSGGPGSGLHLTYDGGKTWKRIGEDEGLPKGDLGRIGVAFAPSDPSIVYAIVEAEKNGIYRSDDGGEHWKKVTEEGRFGNRPFYYADIRVDPTNPERLYSLWSQVSASKDGGKTWEIVVSWSSLHPDHHALWIDPRDPNHLWLGNDGGIGESDDGSRTWRFVANLPLAQLYHVAVDRDVPYNLYGGMQDNGSWRGPAAVWENGGIRNHHWEEVGFGDGFDTRPDPRDSMTGYAMSQEGYLIRWDLRTGERRTIRPPAPDETTELRFNWNAALAVDPFATDTIYYGSQFVHRSTDRGETWSLASPDLTTNNPEWQKQAESGGLTPDVTGAENFTTIVAIAPSPLQKDVLWVGTDDGRVQVTADGGQHWSSVEGGARGVPEHTWVPHITPSSHEPATAYVVFDDHRRSNWETYAYRVDGFGDKWTRLDTDGVRGYALIVAEDPVEPRLLFLGTEFGLWVSLDRGKSFFRWKHGVPTVSVMDLAIEPRESDLVIATHGRALYVMDDIAPLRALDDIVTRKSLHLFAIPDAQQYRSRQTGASRFPGHGEYRGTNEPYGALLTFWAEGSDLPHPDEDLEKERKAKLRAAGDATEAKVKPDEADGKEAKKDEAPKIEIRIAEPGGRIFRTLKKPLKRGLNRVVWGLERDAFREAPRGEEKDDDEDGGGPEVPPGTYDVTLVYGEHTATSKVRVLADPRLTISPEARDARYQAVLRAGALQERLTDAMLRVQSTRADIDLIVAKAKSIQARRKESIVAAGRLPDDDAEKESAEAKLVKQAEEVQKKLTEIEKKFWEPPKTKGIIAETHALGAIGTAQWFLSSASDAPSASQLDYLKRAETRLQVALDELDAFFARDLTEFRTAVKDVGLELLK